MASEKWVNQTASRVMRQLRMDNKKRENLHKPPIKSSDVKETSAYVFTLIKPGNRIGDSGQLLLAKYKGDRKQQYLIKHAYCDCAANEFVYTKLAQAMDIKMPDAALFRLSEGEKRRYFETEYIFGTMYLSIKDESPSYDTIRREATNWYDYFRYLALFDMFLEADSFEVLLANDGFIYRIDTSDAFIINDYFLSQAGINVEANGINPMEFVKKKMLSFDYYDHKKVSNFDDSFEKLKNKYGDDCVQPYFEAFSRIQNISNEYIDSFLNTLCYFYPDFIGDYFKLFIAAVQRISSEFLAARHL
jgi:hypothetical protein